MFKLGRMPILAGAVTLALLTAGPVLAAVPSNDLRADALGVSLGIAQTVDTTEATSSFDDPANCIGEGTDGFTVWYTYTPPQDMNLVATSSGAGFDSVLYVLAGASLVGCAPFSGNSISFHATGGTPLLFMVGSLDGQAGGQMSFLLDTPLVLGISVSATGLVNSKTGVATVSGSVTCNHDVDVFMFVNLTQPVGRLHAVQGGSSVFRHCTFPGFAYSTTVFPFNGKFATGPAIAQAHVDGCAVQGCASTDVTTTVKLHK